MYNRKALSMRSALQFGNVKSALFYDHFAKKLQYGLYRKTVEQSLQFTCKQ